MCQVDSNYCERIPEKFYPINLLLRKRGAIALLSENSIEYSNIVIVIVCALYKSVALIFQKKSIKNESVEKCLELTKTDANKC